VVKQISSAAVFSPATMVQNFETMKWFEKFPDKFYYPFGKPELVLWLSMKQRAPIIKQIKALMTTIVFFETNNYLDQMLFDSIGLIIMMRWYSSLTETMNFAIIH
jgi:hypothetical protein